jgi:hypothetical protein
MLFGATALGLLTIALTWLTNWLGKKVKSEHWSGVVMKVDDVAIKIVRDVFQAYVEPLKIANADGKLTEEEKAHAKSLAMAQLKSYFGEKGLKEIASLVSAGKLDEYLGVSLESALTNTRNAAKIATGRPKKAATRAAVNPR